MAEKKLDIKRLGEALHFCWEDAIVEAFSTDKSIKQVTDEATTQTLRLFEQYCRDNGIYQVIEENAVQMLKILAPKTLGQIGDYLKEVKLTDEVS
jgi:hypothetical protein